MPTLGDFERVMYLNLNQTSDYSRASIGEDFCDVIAHYNEIIVDPSEDEYYLSVERMNVPLQNIPMYVNSDQIQVQWSATSVGAPNNIVTTILGDSYTLTDFLEQLNLAFFNIHENSVKQYVYVKLRPNGRLLFEGNRNCFTHTANRITITFPESLAALLDTPTVIQLGNDPNNNVTESVFSGTPIFNRFNRVKKIILTSNTMSVQSEKDNLTPINALTSIDYSINYNISKVCQDISPSGGNPPPAQTSPFTSDCTLSFEPLQDVTTQPDYPKFVRMGGVPVSVINVAAVAEIQTYNTSTKTWTNSLLKIPLKGGNIFRVKLAIWKRRN